MGLSEISECITNHLPDVALLKVFLMWNTRFKHPLYKNSRDVIQDSLINRRDWLKMFFAQFNLLWQNVYSNHGPIVYYFICCP